MVCEGWLRFAEDVAPEVEWNCADDGLGNVVLIASGLGPNGRAVRLTMPIQEPQCPPRAESAGAIRALAEDVKAQRAA